MHLRRTVFAIVGIGHFLAVVWLSLDLLGNMMRPIPLKQPWRMVALNILLFPESLLRLFGVELQGLLFWFPLISLFWAYCAGKLTELIAKAGN